jgi:thymidylate synthase (FAD)
MVIFTDTFEMLEGLQKKLAKHFNLDGEGIPFHYKKVITSAMRRIAPIGLATTIGWSVNPRELRWVIEMRTHESAEEEIRVVFGKVAEIVVQRYPNFFGDFQVTMIDGLPKYTPENSKV